MYTIFWWLRQSLLTLAACLFLTFGIHVLISAYRLKDPYSFIMAFFASNLMILISAALILGFVIRMVRVYRALKADV
ncbi:MAG: hypothetical protein J7M32_01380 [Deltaproteobacteria bacterium]|nr:hypothetical protein [Deltaproteobacteria bacterium]OQX65866.1 MAG: hypothetical protein B5M55_02440 [Desulfococcus sp. 4484_242]